jgi:erythromycin esterase
MFACRASSRRVFSVLLLALVLILAACSSASAPSHHQTLSADPTIRWIQQNAIPLRTTNQGGSDADLAALSQIVGNASLVGLGEETHGTHEFIDVKARLAEYLITHLGFTTLVMENDWGSSRLLDAYVNGGPGDLVTIMSQSLFGSWQTQEYEAFFAWLRAYNAHPAHTTKVHFYGMDIQAVSQSDFDAVQQYIQQVAPQQVSVVQSLYAPIIASSLPYPYRTYVALNAATKQQYQTQAQRVYDLLQAHQQDYTQRSSPRQFSLAFQDARIIVQFTIYYNSSTQKEALQRYYQRDGFMAENIEWIHDHAAGSNPKLIIWAHDGHIANDTTYSSQDGRNMGGELRAQYKDSYLPIGTTLYQGTFRVYDYPAGVLQAIPPAPANTYNYTLGQAGLRLFMLELRNVPSGPVATWANGAGSVNTLLLYGLGGEDLSTPGPLNQWFDVLVHVQNTTPSQHL